MHLQSIVFRNACSCQAVKTSETASARFVLSHTPHICFSSDQQHAYIKQLITSHVLRTVIKPIYGAASIGVVRVNNMAELERAYKRVTRELAKAHIVAGALQQGEDDEDDDAADEAIEATVSQVSSAVLQGLQWHCGLVPVA